MNTTQPGIMTGIFDMSNSEEEFHRLAAIGFRCLDEQFLCDTDGELYHCSEARFLEILNERKENAKAAGLTFSQAHGPWPIVDTSPQKREQNRLYMQTAVRACAVLGIRYLVVHPMMPYGWNDEVDSEYARDVNADFFTRLCRYAREYEVDICIENMPTRKHKLADIPALIEFVDSLEQDNFHICLDTGHTVINGDDCGEMVRLCGKRLKTLHVHDNDGRIDFHTLPFAGAVDWESFRSALAETGFEGSISIETGELPKAPESIRELYAKLLYECARYLTSY